MSPKRILQLSILVITLIGVILSWRTLKNPATLPVKHVMIQATYKHVDRKTLADIIAPYVTHGLFNVDVDGLEKQLLDIPWVGTVSVKRLWPDKIAIRIVEQQPVAHWGSAALVNSYGEIFTPAPGTAPDDLPLTFNGPEAQAAIMWQYYQQMKTVLAPLKLSIVQVNLTARQSWNLTLDNGVQLLLGRVDVMQRLQRFGDLYPQLVAPHIENVALVDMRYNNGVAVTSRKQAGPSQKR